MGNKAMTKVIEESRDLILEKLAETQMVSYQEGISSDGREIHMILPPLPRPLNELNLHDLRGFFLFFCSCIQIQKCIQVQCSLFTCTCTCMFQMYQISVAVPLKRFYILSTITVILLLTKNHKALLNGFTKCSC